MDGDGMKLSPRDKLVSRGRICLFQEHTHARGTTTPDLPLATTKMTVQARMAFAIK